MSKQAQRGQVICLLPKADKGVTQVFLLPKFMLRTVSPTITTHKHKFIQSWPLGSKRRSRIWKRDGVTGITIRCSDQRCMWPQGVHGKHTCKHNHVHSSVALFTCSVAYPAHLDREDICSVSRMHGEQLLVVQRVPHNCVLVIRTRGQQAASRMRGSDLSSSSWAIFPYPTFPGDKVLGHTDLKAIL